MNTIPDTAQKPLTPLQKMVLNIINSYIKEHLIPPTIKEIKNMMGYKSCNSVILHVKALVKKNHLRKIDFVSRGIVPYNYEGPNKILGNELDLPVINLDLPPLQKKVYEQLIAYIKENHYPPSIIELYKRIPLSSTSGVAYSLKALVKKGLITQEESRSRGLAVIATYRGYKPLK